VNASPPWLVAHFSWLATLAFWQSFTIPEWETFLTLNNLTEDLSPSRFLRSAHRQGFLPSLLRGKSPGSQSGCTGPVSQSLAFTVSIMGWIYKRDPLSSLALPTLLYTIQKQSGCTGPVSQSLAFMVSIIGWIYKTDCLSSLALPTYSSEQKMIYLSILFFSECDVHNIQVGT